MKTFLSVVLTSLFFITISNVLAEDINQSTSKTSDYSVNCEASVIAGLSEKEIAKRGCCSWHDGVCGCTGGRQQCCDGTLSPSCTCNKSDPTVDIPKT
jgi:hypothetical protein